MNPLPFLIRLLPAIAWDIVDFLIGWMPVVGWVLDFAAPIFAYFVYHSGFAALINVWEIFEPTNALDMWVPTMTISAIAAGVQ